MTSETTLRGPDRFAAALAAAGITAAETRHLADSTRTAVAAAEAVGCDVGAIASSLLFFTEDGPLLVMTSGSHRVDEKLLGIVRRATASEVKELTGYTIGGVSPIGHPAPLPTLVDLVLQDHEWIWAAAGHPHAMFRTTFDELVAMTGGTPARVGD